ncbi:hypothetical protein TNCV_4735411 [Trichonephila clavipes]|nr:hypothetical protein TNCV_4735411 [Trichonephila clavipes]
MGIPDSGLPTDILPRSELVERMLILSIWINPVNTYSGKYRYNAIVLVENDEVQQPIIARNYCAHVSIRDLGSWGCLIRNRYPLPASLPELSEYLHEERYNIHLSTIIQHLYESILRRIQAKLDVKGCPTTY